MAQSTTGLAGKVILVTGASRGIGYAAALEAAKRGAHVVAVARTVGGLEELDDEIQDLGSSATLVPLDLRDGEAIDRLGAAIFERWGALDGGETEQSKVKVNVFYPGAVRTAMRAKAMPGENPDTLPTPSEIAPKLVDLLSPAVTESGKLFDMTTGAFSDL